MKFTNTLFYKFIRWIACSFERCSNGSSARKFTMWSYMTLVVFLHLVIGKMFLAGQITETKSLIWILLGFLLNDSITILLLAQILTGHDITEMLNATKIKDETNTTEPPTTG